MATDGKHQRSKQNAKIYVVRATTTHNLLFCFCFAFVSIG